ncbi:phox/Bem1p domain containing protein [Rhodotorula toruloides]|uniref:Phox/Bem1p domain containing protein n=1 Tax=Rhodotorula toruloides TaxID=5286 RepID=A0A511KNH7_RHOTO|nr:phox/Bem1p domain containing protein [Rhodotorula toruloides]
MVTSVPVKVTLHSASDSPTTRALVLPTETAPSWDALRVLIQQRFTFGTAPTTLSYIDADGDEITLSSSEEVAELWTVVRNGGVLSFSIGHHQEPTSPIDNVALLASVEKALEGDHSFGRDLRSLVKSAGSHDGRSRHDRSRESALHGHHAYRRDHHGHVSGKLGRIGGNNGGRGGFAGFCRHNPAYHGFDTTKLSGSDSETFEQPSDSHGPFPSAHAHFPNPLSGHHGHGRHHCRPHHDFGPPPLFPLRPPFAFPASRRPSHRHERFQ